MSTHRTRRTVAAATALAALALLAACSGTGSPEAAPTTSASVPASAAPSGAAPAAAPPAAPALAGPVLGPYGLGRLRLGQTRAEALATGEIGGVDGSGRCGPVELLAAPATEAESSGVTFSDKLGLVAIHAFAGVRTAEGLAEGATYEELKRTYGLWVSATGDGGGKEGHGLVDVPNNAMAHYRIEVHQGKVRGITLQLKKQDCYE